LFHIVFGSAGRKRRLLGNLFDWINRIYMLKYLFTINPVNLVNPVFDVIFSGLYSLY